MPFISANGIDIAYETFGNLNDPPLLLIMGLGCQMVAWPEPFCETLAARGRFVVRFDNRDVGLSSKIDDAGVPNVLKTMALVQEGKRVDSPYTLSDMASDVVDLMDSLELKKSHVCGLSMGGMIAQTLAIEHPKRLLSLISMESSTGEPDLPAATPRAVEAMLTPPSHERDAYINNMAGIFRVFAGGSDRFDETLEKKIAAISYDRCHYPFGFARQMAAILAAGGRRKSLGSVKIPTLVIHGAQDPLVPLAHGKDTASAIAGSKLMVVQGLGHGFSYPDLWDEIAEAIAQHTAGAI